MKVKDIMTENVIAVNKDATVEEVARLLVDNNVSSMPVVDDQYHVVGMISEKDLLYKELDPTMPATVEYFGGIIFLDGVDEYQEELKKLTATKAEQMMNKDVFTVHEEDDISEVARLLAHSDIDSIPVVRGDKLVGMVKSKDIIQAFISGN